VIGVEPERSQAMTAALAAGEPVTVEVGGVAADSLGAARVGEHTFPIVQGGVERIVHVGDDAIREAQRALWDDVHMIAEPGGAAAFAALRSGAYEPSPGERICVLVCGANCDPASVTGSG
jgi:threonine dehydratase